MTETSCPVSSVPSSTSISYRDASLAGAHHDLYSRNLVDNRLATGRWEVTMSFRKPQAVAGQLMFRPTDG